MTSKTCGRETSCALLVDHPSVAGVHALIELADDGLISVQDNHTEAGTFLGRNDSWIRISRVTLCIGDRIKLADIEVSLQQLLAVFGNESNARLEARHFPFRQGNNAARSLNGQLDQEPLLQKPRRNPATGKVEEQPR